MAGITNEIYERTVVLPITEEARNTARQLAARQPTSEKAEQVLLNTLAVSVVDNYLQMMDIPTDIAASYSRNAFVCLCSDVSDLVVTGLGRLECRPVTAQEQTCHVPVDVWGDRIGYTAVQMDEALEEAAILGFIPTVEAEEIPLHQFQPLRNLLRSLNQPREKVSPSVSATAQLTNLSQWLRNAFETGWQTLDSLVSTPQTNLAFGFRQFRKDGSSRGGKTIDLQTPQGNYSIILAVSLASSTESTSVSEESEIDIHVQVIPAMAQTSLPPGLQLMILDESGAIFEETQALSEDDFLLLQISGHPGEKFSIRVALGDISTTEDFVI
ncbi:hypothetical protein WA1_47720 [Scytonema hofmannii PCC 7110]|uniref:DUF1822 domain-containing protein n=1 Tax=Scytonema hofmannii PCC 7110 TaxID=128403 RepID=A0A139WXY9_9CYAN|nr:DUF1822 family protein [Scytonema hofmannii]KYC37311.1 hypothetical protein WA1_47720 [Scytonema hofmannii PCC 7110]